MRCRKCGSLVVHKNLLTEPSTIKFECLNCGEISKDDVLPDDYSSIIDEQMNIFDNTFMPSILKYSKATQKVFEETLRAKAAIAAMQGVMNFFGSIDYNKETIAKLAVEQADALIEELKKEK